MRSGSTSMRVACALLAAASLLGPAVARAASSDEGLSPDALTHLRRGAEYYRRGAYSQAEVEFTRAEHFAPQWHGLRFNQGAAAEAQGKLDVAIEHYSAYLPHADEHQKQSLELRLEELERRRDEGLEVWRKQRAIGWSVMGGGIALLGGGIGMLVAGRNLEGTSKTRMQTGGYILGTTGLVLAVSSGVSLLRRANRTKKAIRGLALAPAGSPEGFGGSMSFRF